MVPEIKKLLQIGVGAALLTKDMIDASVQRMVERSEISEAEARELTHELMKKGESQWMAVEKMFNSAFRKGLDAFDIAQKDAFQKLEKRVNRLEFRVLQLEANRSPKEDSRNRS